MYIENHHTQSSSSSFRHSNLLAIFFGNDRAAKPLKWLMVGSQIPSYMLMWKKINSRHAKTLRTIFTSNHIFCLTMKMPFLHMCVCVFVWVLPTLSSSSSLLFYGYFKDRCFYCGNACCVVDEVCLCVYGRALYIINICIYAHKFGIWDNQGNNGIHMRKLESVLLYRNFERKWFI